MISTTRRIDAGRLLGRLEDDAVAGGERGGELPRRHEDGEVPRDDLPDDAERLVEVVGHRVVVDLGDSALLRADASGEVAEVVDRQRKVGGEGLADRLAVLPGLEDGELLEVLLQPVGDLEQDVAPLGRRRATPCVLGVRRGLDGGVDVGCLAAGHRDERLAVDGRDVLERLAVLGWDPLAADEVVELRRQNHLRAVRIGGCKHHDRTSLSLRRRASASPPAADARSAWVGQRLVGSEVGRVDGDEFGARRVRPVPEHGQRAFDDLGVVGHGAGVADDDVRARVSEEGLANGHREVVAGRGELGRLRARA